MKYYLFKKNETIEKGNEILEIEAKKIEEAEQKARKYLIEDYVPDTLYIKLGRFIIKKLVDDMIKYHMTIYREDEIMENRE